MSEPLDLRWLRAFTLYRTASPNPSFLSAHLTTRYCVACGEPVNGSWCYTTRGPMLGGYPHGTHLHGSVDECQDALDHASQNSLKTGLQTP